MVPVIGLTSFDDHKNNSTYISLNGNYTYSVSAAGGLPVVLPGLTGLGSGSVFPEAMTESELAARAEAYTHKLDGLVLTGGGDICPYLYGEETQRGIGRFDSNRDRWELALFASARAKKFPSLPFAAAARLSTWHWVALFGKTFQASCPMLAATPLM